MKEEDIEMPFHYERRSRYRVVNYTYSMILITRVL